MTAFAAASIFLGNILEYVFSKAKSRAKIKKEYGSFKNYLLDKSSKRIKIILIILAVVCVYTFIKLVTSEN